MGAYRLIRRIGSPGGVVETSAGVSAIGEKSVFLKRIVDPRRGLAEKFIESSKLLRAPGLPTVLDVGTSHEGLWFVTEGGEGESLRWVMTTWVPGGGGSGVFSGRSEMTRPEKSRRFTTESARESTT